MKPRLILGKFWPGSGRGLGFWPRPGPGTRLITGLIYTISNVCMSVCLSVFLQLVIFNFPDLIPMYFWPRITIFESS